MKLKNNEKWAAVVSCDNKYDGNFFYGVKTTGIFCKPSCKSKQPLRENVKFFDEIEQAYADNFRPCKRCRPDLIEYKPMKELAEEAKNIFDNCFDDPQKLKLNIKNLGVSQNRLINLFREQFQCTPLEYINKLRVGKAIKFIENSDNSILNIAMLSGFGSLSSFYHVFKKHMSVSPGEYKKMISKELGRLL